MQNTQIYAELKELAAMPPNPDGTPSPPALIKIGDLLTAILTNPTVTDMLPASWKGYVAIVVTVIALITAGRVTAPITPPVIVNNHPSAPISQPEQGQGQGQELRRNVTVTAYVTSDAEKAIASTAKVMVDSKLYPTGSTYTFKDKTIPLPCITIAVNGIVIDVEQFTTVDDIAKALK